RERLRSPVLLVYAAVIPILIAATWWSTRLPAIVDGLPGKKFIEVGAAFQQRLLFQHPVGSPASALASDLRAAGFTIGAGSATYSSRFLVCAKKWTARWSVTPPDRLGAITGSYGETCL
ncbi:MAG: hypothetical protein ACRYG4_20525, partial [Janthinobacterium lividum]